MITGKSYDEIRLELFGLAGKVGPMYGADVANLICKKGFHVSGQVYPMASEPKRPEDLRGPFAPVHLVEIRVFEDSEQMHFIVMDEVGKLYDPLFGETDWNFYAEHPSNIVGFTPE